MEYTPLVAKVTKNISLHPKIAEALHSVCKAEELSYPQFFATESRIKRWFADRGESLPVPGTPGRPLKLSIPPPAPAPSLPDMSTLDALANAEPDTSDEAIEALIAAKAEAARQLDISSGYHREASELSAASSNE